MRACALCARAHARATRPEAQTRAGAAELLAAFRASAPASVDVKECKCRGACKNAPVVQLDGPTYGPQKLKVRRQPRCAAPRAAPSATQPQRADAPSRAASQRVHPAECATLLQTHLY